MKTKRKPKPSGRPEYQPTDKERAQVKALSGMGLTQEEIALVIGMSEPTLRKHFRMELDVGMLEANAKVAQSLFRQATSNEKPNVAASIFWLKARAGWRENSGGVVERPELKGKKEQQQEDAKTAQVGTEWNDLLTPARPQ